MCALLALPCRPCFVPWLQVPRAPGEPLQPELAAEAEARRAMATAEAAGQGGSAEGAVGGEWGQGQNAQTRACISAILVKCV